jgi:hypothetical protein
LSGETLIFESVAARDSVPRYRRLARARIEGTSMEPVSLLVGAVLVAAGFVAGRLQRRRPGPPPPPVTPLCGCGHALSQHDRETATCYAELRRDAYDKRGRWAGHTWVPCTCRQYVGPRPIDEVFVPRVLPPSD